MNRRLASMLLVVLVSAAPAVGWGERGHVAITQAAVELLDAGFPEFVKTDAARARLAYLSVEPDRWRNLNLAPMGHINKPEHYFGIEALELYGLTPETLPGLRHEYIAAMVRYKVAHPEKDYGYNPARDRDGSREWPGMAPYRICELYVQLKSSWRTYNTYSKYADVAGVETLQNCRQNIVYLMGMMSHYVADTAQPLHTTKHHHGWEGDNPKGYTTERGIHSYIDTGVLNAAGIDHRTLLVLKPPKRILDDRRLFEAVMRHVVEAHNQVEPLYELDRRGVLRPESPEFAEGAAFIKRRLSAGAGMLAALWESAHRGAGIDEFRERILRRQLRAPVEAKAEPAAVAPK